MPAIPGATFPASACTPSGAPVSPLGQEVGGSAIEASKIDGHANVSMTNEYTKVKLKRQDELTRAIQERIEGARKKLEEKANQQAQEKAVA